MGTGSERTGAAQKQPETAPPDKPVLRKDYLRRLRRYFWFQNLALHRPLPPCHLAMQRKIQRRSQVRNATSDRGAPERTVFDGLGRIPFRSGRCHQPAPLRPKGTYGHRFYRCRYCQPGRRTERCRRNAAGVYRQNAANTVTEESYRAAHDDLCSHYKEIQTKLATLQNSEIK